MPGRSAGRIRGREEVIEQVQKHAGLLGTGVTGGSSFVGWSVAHTPELQAVSFEIAIVAGALTVIWYVVKLGVWLRSLFK